MRVQEQGHNQCIDKAGGMGVKGSGATSILELDVTQAELRGTPVQIGFRILAQAQAEIHTNLYQV